MNNLVEILREVISEIDLCVDVETIDGINFEVCGSTKTITECKIVEDDQGNKFIVSDNVGSFVANEKFTLTPVVDGTIFSGTKVFAPVPLFLHGTPRSLNREYIDLDHSTLNKTPFIWLLENYDYDEGASDSSFTTYDFRLFLLDWADESCWSTDEHNNKVVKPMENLRELIKESISKNPRFRELSNLRTTPRTRFGVYVTNSGHEEKIIDEDLTGIELRFNLEAYDLDDCKNC